LLTAIPRASVAQASPESTPNKTAGDQLIRAQTAKEEAEAAYYREQIAKLHEPSKPKTFWQNVEDNPASVLGVLGAIIAALAGLFSLYKSQRLTIETQYDAQFYEALKRFGDKDSARLRSSAVGLLIAMASHNISKDHVRRDNKAASKYFTVLNQLVAGSRLEEHRVVLNAIKNALEVLGKIEPASVMEALYKANINLQADLKTAMQALSFHFRETDDGTTGDTKVDARLKLSPAMWRPLEQVTGFDSHLLYKWFASITNNFLEYDESAAAEVDSMTLDEKTKHKQRALEQVRITAHQLKQNVEACCSTLLQLAKKLDWPVSKTVGGRFRARMCPLLLRPKPNYRTALELDGIFLVQGRLSGLQTVASTGNVLKLSGAFLNGVDLSRANMIGTNFARADLTDARLEETVFAGADLSDAVVNRAKLWRTKFDQTSILGNLQWWTADFYDTRTVPNSTAESNSIEEPDVDFALVMELRSRSKRDLFAGAHESVSKCQKMAAERAQCEQRPAR